jgi:nitronate monooxygenase
MGKWWEPCEAANPDVVEGFPRTSSAIASRIGVTRRGSDETKRLKDLLGIDLPIIQAPMAGSQDSGLAISVSETGALGSLPCALLTVDAMRSELSAIRNRTNRPLNVNFFCHSQPGADAQREAKWRAALAPYYREYGIDPETIASGSGRAPFSSELADALSDFVPSVVSFHFGLPTSELLARVKGWGSKVLSSATTVEEAVWLEQHGADAIIAQGAEAGGHRGMFLTQDVTTQMGTFALVPQVVSAVRVPVIAAGGIADAHGVAAAISLGAAGVQVGTTYLLCPEATTGPVHRAAIRSDAVSHTALTRLLTGRPARGIINRIMRELGPLGDVAPAFPLAGAAIAPLRAKAESQGSGDFSPLWCGQNASGCSDLSAAELTMRLAAGLE